MGKRILIFVNTEIKKKVILLLWKSYYFNRYMSIEEILVCNKTFSSVKSYKYFIGYLYNYHKVKPLHVMLSKPRAYVISDDRQIKCTVEKNEVFH